MNALGLQTSGVSRLSLPAPPRSPNSVDRVDRAQRGLYRDQRVGLPLGTVFSEVINKNYPKTGGRGWGLPESMEFFPVLWDNVCTTLA